MIVFKDSPTSTATIAVVLTVFFLFLIISSFLNPIVFFYNKKKTSIAGILFCVLSATDLLTCIASPLVTLYYAITLDLTVATCLESKTIARQPQNCYYKVSPTHIATSFTILSLNCTSFITTSVLAIVRSIQIKYPFYPLRKSVVLILLSLSIAAQIILWTFNMVSPFIESKFVLTFNTVLSQNVFDLPTDSVKIEVHKLSNILSSLPLSITQFLAVLASILTAITLYQQRNSVAASISASTRRRTVSAIKVMLTNVPSLVYGLVFGSPLALLIPQGAHGDLESELQGWLAFLTLVWFPVFTSVWNPVVFTSLTPKSWKSLSTFIVKLCRKSTVTSE